VKQVLVDLDRSALDHAYILLDLYVQHNA
jgi:hypothetical protein